MITQKEIRHIRDHILSNIASLKVDPVTMTKDQELRYFVICECCQEVREFFRQALEELDYPLSID